MAGAVGLGLLIRIVDDGVGGLVLIAVTVLLAVGQPTAQVLLLAEVIYRRTRLG